VRAMLEVSLLEEVAALKINLLEVAVSLGSMLTWQPGVQSLPLRSCGGAGSHLLVLVCKRKACWRSAHESSAGGQPARGSRSLEEKLVGGRSVAGQPVDVATRCRKPPPPVVWWRRQPSSYVCRPSLYSALAMTAESPADRLARA
jgi:hypothetical protein